MLDRRILDGSSLRQLSYIRRNRLSTQKNECEFALKRERLGTKQENYNLVHCNNRECGISANEQGVRAPLWSSSPSCPLTLLSAREFRAEEESVSYARPPPGRPRASTPAPLPL